MASSTTHRKLTAVFVTDVVGYSRLMGDDPDATVKTLAEYRTVFFDHIQQHKGRVVNAPGDSILAEFSSVVDAVDCAVEIQRELAERNVGLPEARRMHFRIGVNLGDVLVKDGELFGDGVNIAARLEALAEPGGICISRTVYDQVESRLPLHYEYIGEHAVKNIAKPVRAYKVLSAPGAAAHRVIEARRNVSGKWRNAALAVAAAVVLVVAGLLAWNTWQPAHESEPAAKDEAEGPPLPKRPSIAVLPFVNMSGDPEQEYFSDGFTEDLITDLSKIRQLFVIARNSTFRYKGRAVDVKQVGRELGVRFVLEGSVRKAGARIRISAQLIEAATGSHRWAERYDGELKDMFALQDQIGEKIVSALKVQLTMQETERMRRVTTDNVEAWEFYVRGMRELHRFISRWGGIIGLKSRGPLIARVEFEKALELHPDFAAALLGLGWTYQIEGMGPGSFLQATADPLGRAAELARKARDLSENAAEPYALLGQIHLVQRQHDQAVDFARRAVALSPNSADWHAYLAQTLNFSGKPDEALAEIGMARRLNPFQPNWYREILGRSLYLSGRVEEAIAPLKTAIARALRDIKIRDQLILRFKASRSLFLLAAYGAAGREKEAAEIVAMFRESLPNFQPKSYLSWAYPFKDSSDVDRLLADLAKAGLK